MLCVAVAKKNESERKREKEAENGFQSTHIIVHRY